MSKDKDKTDKSYLMYVDKRHVRKNYNSKNPISPKHLINQLNLSYQQSMPVHKIPSIEKSREKIEQLIYRQKKRRTGNSVHISGNFGELLNSQEIDDFSLAKIPNIDSK